MLSLSLNKYAKDGARDLHAVIEGPQYEHAIGEAAVNDRRQGSGLAYEEVGADRGGAPIPRRIRQNPVARIFPVLLPFRGTFQWMCRFGGDGCREEFRP